MLAMLGIVEVFRHCTNLSFLITSCFLRQLAVCINFDCTQNPGHIAVEADCAHFLVCAPTCRFPMQKPMECLRASESCDIKIFQFPRIFIKNRFLLDYQLFKDFVQTKGFAMGNNYLTKINKHIQIDIA